MDQFFRDLVKKQFRRENPPPTSHTSDGSFCEIVKRVGRKSDPFEGRTFSHIPYNWHNYIYIYQQITVLIRWIKFYNIDFRPNIGTRQS
jgi:hypothetical protein